MAWSGMPQKSEGSAGKYTVGDKTNIQPHKEWPGLAWPGPLQGGEWPGPLQGREWPGLLKGHEWPGPLQGGAIVCHIRSMK